MLSHCQFLFWLWTKRIPFDSKTNSKTVGTIIFLLICKESEIFFCESNIGHEFLCHRPVVRELTPLGIMGSQLRATLKPSVPYYRDIRGVLGRIRSLSFLSMMSRSTYMTTRNHMPRAWHLLLHACIVISVVYNSYVMCEDEEGQDCTICKYI